MNPASSRIRTFLLAAVLAAPGSGADLDRDALGEYVDRTVRAARARLGIPGVAVVAVHRGEVILKQAWGLARVEGEVVADPDTTIWPVFSVTKPFTATAVMELVRRGTLRLDDPAERHLGRVRFRGSPGGTPITIHHLLTQTSGLDEQVTGIVALPGAPADRMEDVLLRALPPRVRPAGEVFQYSIGFNHTLLGHVIENVTGKDWDAAMEELVLEPLGMTDSSFRHAPIPAPREALGYDPLSSLLGRPRLVPHAAMHVRPAGSLRTTGRDMARFLIAHLEGRTYQDAPFLDEATRAAMRARQFSAHPALPGVGYGFMRQGEAIEHAGGPLPHLASVFLLPGERFGIFLATNTPTGGRLMKGLHRELAEEFFPGSMRHPAPEVSGPPPDPEGLYQLAWRPRHGLQRIVGALPAIPVLRVREAEEGVLRVSVLGFPGANFTARHVGGPVFERERDRGALVFHPGQNGVAARLHTGFLQPYTSFPFTFERIHPAATWPAQLALMALAWGVFLLGGPVVLLARGLARLRGTLAPARPDARWWLARALACTNLAWMLAPAVAFLDTPLVRWPGYPFGIAASARLLLALGPLSLVATGALLVLTLRRGPASRGDALLLVAFLGFLPLAARWGLTS